MGTSGAYSGSGGKPGKAIREQIAEWLEAGTPVAEVEAEKPRIDPKIFRNAVQLIRPTAPRGGGGDGPGSGGAGGPAPTSGRGSRSSGGPQRSAAQSARTAGRAAAAALAFRAADVATLARLGLDYAELVALNDRHEVLRRIVVAACSTPDSTIEDHEQRLVAADVAEWILDLESGGYIPTPEEIVRQTIAMIVAEVVLVEAGQLINDRGQATVSEKDIRDAAEAWASTLQLSADGTTEDEIARGIERGIDTIRGITRGGS